MSEEEADCREVIYDLTELKAKDQEKLTRLMQLYKKRIENIESELSHFRQVARCYSDLIAKISSILETSNHMEAPTGSNKQLGSFEQYLQGIGMQLAALKESKIKEIPVIVERIIEVEIPIEVIKEIEIERVVEVPVERNVVEEVIIEREVEVEVEKHVFIEKVVEVEKYIQIERIIEKEVEIYITRQVEVECSYCKTGKV